MCVGMGVRVCVCVRLCVLLEQKQQEQTACNNTMRVRELYETGSERNMEMKVKSMYSWLLMACL